MLRLLFGDITYDINLYSVTNLGLNENMVPSSKDSTYKLWNDGSIKIKVKRINNDLKDR